MPFLARLPLSPLSGLIAYLLSDVFPCKLHFPDSHHLVSSRVLPWEAGWKEKPVHILPSLCAIETSPIVTASLPKFSLPSVKMAHFSWFFFPQQLLKIAILETVSPIDWLSLHHVPTPREREDRFLSVSGLSSKIL